MNGRAKLSVFLVFLGLGVGAVVALGVGANERPARAVRPPAPEGAFLSAVADETEIKLWNARGCVTCHGVEARGGQMGPDLSKVVPLYLAKFGSAQAARTRLVEYLVDPQGSPKLRDDGAQYPNPMPSVLKLFGGTKADAETLADLLLRAAK